MGTGEREKRTPRIQFQDDTQILCTTAAPGTKFDCSIDCHRNLLTHKTALFTFKTFLLPRRMIVVLLVKQLKREL